MTPDTTVTFAFISILLGIFLGIAGFLEKRDAKKIQEGREHGVIITELQEIKSGNTNILDKLNQIERSVDKLENKVEDIDKRVIVLETKRVRSSAKT